MTRFKSITAVVPPLDMVAELLDTSFVPCLLGAGGGNVDILAAV